MPTFQIQKITNFIITRYNINCLLDTGLADVVDCPLIVGWPLVDGILLTDTVDWLIPEVLLSDDTLLIDTGCELLENVPLTNGVLLTDTEV